MDRESRESRESREQDSHRQDRHRDRVREYQDRQHQDQAKEEQVRQYRGERDKKDHHSYPPEPCNSPPFKTSPSENMLSKLRPNLEPLPRIFKWQIIG